MKNRRIQTSNVFFTPKIVLQDIISQFYEDCRDGITKDVKQALSLVDTGNHPKLVQYRRQKNKENWTPLHIACARGHYDVVKVLLKVPGIEIDAKDAFKRTPLYLAARHGWAKIVAKLIAAEADVHALSKHGRTILMEAVAYFAGSHVVDLLVKARAEVNASDEEGRTALMEAARYGWDKVVHKLLAADAAIDAVAKDGKTALIEAASLGKEAAVEKLLAAGAKTDIHDKDGKTALIRAVSNLDDRDDVVAQLLNAGANVDAMDEDGKTALQQAEEQGNKHCVKILKAARTRKEFFEHCRDGNYGVVAGTLAAANQLLKTLLLKYFDKDCNNNTPLHVASYNGHESVVSTLLQTQAGDINAKDLDGSTPLHHASRKGHSEVTGLLVVEKDIKPNEKDNNGWAPLHHAAAEGHESVVSSLVTCPTVDVNVQTTLTGDTALHLACEANSAHTIPPLLHAKADIDAKNNDGDTPLTKAKEMRSRKCEEIIQIEKDRRQALSLAQQKRQAQDIAIKDMEGKMKQAKKICSNLLSKVDEMADCMEVHNQYVDTELDFAEEGLALMRSKLQKLLFLLFGTKVDKPPQRSQPQQHKRSATNIAYSKLSRQRRIIDPNETLEESLERITLEICQQEAKRIRSEKIRSRKIRREIRQKQEDARRHVGVSPQDIQDMKFYLHQIENYSGGFNSVRKQKSIIKQSKKSPKTGPGSPGFAVSKAGHVRQVSTLRNRSRNVSFAKENLRSSANSEEGSLQRSNGSSQNQSGRPLSVVSGAAYNDNNFFSGEDFIYQDL